MTNKELRATMEKHIEELNILMNVNKDNKVKDGDIDAAMVTAYRNIFETALAEINRG